MEYVGDPFEKLLGFFIAVVILTFYIGVINLLLMFVSFSVFDGNGAGYLASVAGVVPLWFYARWRARRYVLGRTRWRGVRFALEPAAWRYTGRGLMHWGITILTLGLLWPRMTFSLEKFRTDHTLFGDQRFHQGGKWTMLYRAGLPFVVALIAATAFALWLLVLNPVLPGLSLNDSLPDLVQIFTELYIVAPERLWLAPLFVLALLYGAIHYAYVSKRIMANHKTLNGVKLTSDLRPVRVSCIYVFGYILAYTILVLGIIALVLMAIPVLGLDGMQRVMESDLPLGPDIPTWLGYPLLILMYFGVFLMWSVFSNVFVTFPLMRHLTATLSVQKSDGLAEISQRKRDEFAEAEGFAEALDLGAAI